MIQIIQGDCVQKLTRLKPRTVNTCITSPPYWLLRDYGTGRWVGGRADCDHLGDTMRAWTISNATKAPREFYREECPKCGAKRVDDKQLGLEETPERFLRNMVRVFRFVKNALRNDGTLWLNMGDSYHHHNLQLNGMPWRLALALQEDGWILRQDIIWHKPNPMPESVKNRCTKAHEYIFLFSKTKKYYFDHKGIMEEAVYEEGLRAKRSVWTQAGDSAPQSDHFATYPQKLIEPCVIAGSPKGGVVLDPFAGLGTTGIVAENLGRDSIMIELSKEYIREMKKRIKKLT
jgi:DNA modification methylase